jgi:hypothetical protein
VFRPRRAENSRTVASPSDATCTDRSRAKTPTVQTAADIAALRTCHHAPSASHPMTVLRRRRERSLVGSLTRSPSTRPRRCAPLPLRPRAGHRSGVERRAARHASMFSPPHDHRSRRRREVEMLELSPSRSASLSPSPFPGADPKGAALVGRRDESRAEARPSPRRSELLGPPRTAEAAFARAVGRSRSAASTSRRRKQRRSVGAREHGRDRRPLSCST